MKKIFILLIIILTFNNISFAKMTADEIIKKSHTAKYFQGFDSTKKVEMHLSDGSDEEFIILRKNFDIDQKFYIYFTEPQDVKATSFIIHKYAKRENEIWNFLPELDLTKQIANKDKRTSFMKSTFFYEDITGRNPNDDYHELSKTTDNFYIIKSTPKVPDSVEFSYYETWVHNGSFLPIKIIYFNKLNEISRQYEALGVEEIDGYRTITKSVMNDFETGKNTNLVFNDVDFDVELESAIFTKKYLKNPPRNWLK